MLQRAAGLGGLLGAVGMGSWLPHGPWLDDRSAVRTALAYRKSCERIVVMTDRRRVIGGVMALVILYILYFSASLAMFYVDMMAAYQMLMIGFGFASIQLFVFVMSAMGIVLKSRVATRFFVAGVVVCAVLIDWKISLAIPLVYLLSSSFDRSASSEISLHSEPGGENSQRDTIKNKHSDCFVNPSNLMHKSMVGTVGKLNDE